MTGQTARGEPAGNGALDVFFDGSCPLCRAEIAYYRRKAEPGAVRFVDVSQDDEATATLLPDGLERSRAMARFHVRRQDGTVLSGARAFATLWRVTPGFKTAGLVAGSWGIRHVLEGAYRAFLPVRPLLQRAAGTRDGKTSAGDDCADGTCQRP